MDTQTELRPRGVTDLVPTSWAWQFKATNIEAKERTFEGLSNTWELDLGGDVVKPGAFKRTIGRWRKSGRIIPLLDNHDAFTSVTSVVGKLVEASETDAGLLTKFEVIDDDRGNAILRRIEGGFVDGLSIGYRPVKIEEPSEEERRGGVWRFLTEVELREVSVVIFPMNTSSRIDAESVKTLLAEADVLLRLQEPTPDEQDELSRLRADIELLTRKGLPGAQDADGIAPDSGVRVAQLATLRALKLRRIAAPV